MHKTMNEVQTIEDIRLIRESIAEFCKEHIAPYVMEWDESQYFPREVFEKLGEMGMMGVLVPPEYGGVGLGYHGYVAIGREISKLDPSIGLCHSADNSLWNNQILQLGGV